MPLTALVLVLLAALLHALWNVVAKQAGGDHRFVFITASAVALLWAPVAVWFGWHELPRWGWREWTTVGASAAVHSIYYVVLLKGYRASDLTVVYPVARGSGPLLATFGALLVLGETLTPAGGAGAVAVCGGVFLIAGGPRLWRHAHDPAAAARVRAGLRWGMLTGALIAVYTVIDGYAVKVLLVGPVLLDYMGNLLRVPMLLPAAMRDRAALATAWRAQWRHALVVALLSPLAYVLVLYAVSMAPLSHVAPAREVSMLIAALIGGRLLREGDRVLRLLGAACIASGVVALALG